MVPFSRILAGPRRAALPSVLLLSLVLCATSARAQEVSARDQQSAAEAYDRGTAAYLARDYTSAARWFETAHRLAPAAAALIQAVRSHARAGNAVRAATLALRLQALYANDANAARAAAEALADATQLVRVDVRCEGCSVQLDGTLQEHPSFFVEAGGEHTIVAEFDTGRRSETVRGAAGETRTLSFDAPAAPEGEVETSEGRELARPVDGQGAEVVPATRGGGVGVLPWPIVLIGIAGTVGLGATLIWSGIDTLDGVPAYEANPTEAALADGRSREERTNWLIAGTAAMAGVTVLLAIFTDWGGGAPSSTQAGCGIQEDGAGCSLRGRF
ncbi:MAG: hypothetical protein IT378_23505 [Sandaracinaceae bacterium]|nr:hypothetical protein [Sandaracinaceae bacterium]